MVADGRTGAHVGGGGGFDQTRSNKVKQGQERSDATTCSRNIVRAWAQTFSLPEPIRKYPRTCIMAAARFLLAAKTATESETLFPTPTRNAGTRGAYYLLLPATSAICWRMGVSAAPNGVRILALVTCERKQSCPPFEFPAIQHVAASLACLIY